MHPKAGGAELVTFEVARRLVERGDSVEWFSATFPQAKPEEAISGVNFVRGGRQWSVHWAAFRRYGGRIVDHFDVVVDQVNTIPFLTPLWAGVPIVMLIHQLAREVWWYESPFPINLLGYFAEPLYLRPYRRVQVLTVSQSTRNDLTRLGFGPGIRVIPEGLERLTSPPHGRPAEPRFIYAGRLAPSKRVSDVIKAFAIFCDVVPGSCLTLIGEGPPRHVERLRSLTDRLRLTGRVRFLGRVSTLAKHFEMANSHMLLLASVREGWGLVVTEANAFGTPAIAYNVPGLCDSIRDGETGLLVRPSPDALARAMVGLWRDHAAFERMSDAAKRWSSTFTFDDTTQAFRDGLEAAIAAASPTPVTGVDARC